MWWVFYTTLKLLMLVILLVNSYLVFSFRCIAYFYPCFVNHLRSHSNLPSPLANGNAQADNLVSWIALGLPMQTAAPVEIMLCTFKMLQPFIGNFTLPGSRLDKSLNHVNSMSHVCHKCLRELTPGAFGLESCDRCHSCSLLWSAVLCSCVSGPFFRLYLCLCTCW
jgi:hypothetical protein